MKITCLSNEKNGYDAHTWYKYVSGFYKPINFSSLSKSKSKSTLGGTFKVIGFNQEAPQLALASPYANPEILPLVPFWLARRTWTIVPNWRGMQAGQLPGFNRSVSTTRDFPLSAGLQGTRPPQPRSAPTAGLCIDIFEMRRPHALVSFACLNSGQAPKILFPLSSALVWLQAVSK